MFEDFYVDAHESHAQNKQQRLRQLLQKYVELQRLQDLETNEQLTTNQRKRLLNGKTKRKILRRIHEQLNRRLRPEETFEVWHEHRNLNVNLKRQHPPKGVEGDVEAVLSSNENQVDENTSVVDDDEEDENDEGSIASQLARFTSSFDESNSWTKTNLLIRTRGLEVLPARSTPPGFTKYHVNNLKNLLHINILRRNWQMAYKVFCLLVRLPNVDIRSVWPLGVEILRQQQKLNGKNQPTMYKDDRFFDWLASFFIISRSAGNQTRMISAPIWRSGSRTHTPLYIIMSLWSLLVRQEYSKLNDRLEELLLEPPFNTDGVFFFISALCKLSECIELIRQGANGFKDTIVNNCNFVEKQLEQCKELHFAYPRDLIHNELKSVLAQLDGPTKTTTTTRETTPSSSSESSDDENDDEPPENISFDVPMFEEKRRRMSTTRLPSSPPSEYLENEYDEGHIERDEGIDFDFDFE
ncbi:hypothetical protein CAAN1_20S00936 [[Candida] anglica]|uniref:RNA polymerase I-specific transcription initiation factor RRN11 n=1 Tax=[Candida] anglica TaxID=148631 RepID=A0ABP0EJC4_9ASCO